MSGVGVRVSIPSSLRKTIQDIKEITGNHSEEEIYAMLKDCSMDPNETAQKLLLQDTFHEVKRKRDRKKENTINRESGDPRWRPSTQGRGSRGGRVNIPSRYTSHDASGGKAPGSARGNGSNLAADKDAGASLLASQAKSKETSASASSAGVLVDGAIGEVPGTGTAVPTSKLPAGVSASKIELSSSTTPVGNLKSTESPINTDKTPTIAFGTGDAHGEPVLMSSSSSVPVAPTSSSTVCLSSSDPVLVPSSDPRDPGIVGTIKREVSDNRTVAEPHAAFPAEKSSSEIRTPFLQWKMPSKTQVGKGQPNESSQSSSAPINGGSSGSRPSSNYSSRAQQISSIQRGGSTKEWKPKSANSNMFQGSEAAGSSDAPNNAVEVSVQTQPLPNVLDSDDASSELQKKFMELHIPQRQHVIIPNHIHVPESERIKLSFGSFDANYVLTTSHSSGPGSDKSSTPFSETSEGVDEIVEEQPASNLDSLENAEEGAYLDHPESPTHVPENLSAEEDVSSSTVPDYPESKQETALLPGGQQYSVVHTSPSYRFGLVPPILSSSQISPPENSQSQACDVSRLASFVIQQPIDPTSYYAQFYRSGADGDGRGSPFPSPAVAAKYNGNVAVLPPHTASSTQEGGNSLVLSTGGPTPLAAQASGLMQSSMAVTQQPLPVFRPPTGLHIPHYPPNYIPYGPYLSPFYVPPPGIHQFLSNSAFPQQPPQAGSMYPAPQAAAAMGVKYPLPQFKPGSNSGNSTHMGTPSGYGQYGSSPAGYNPSSVAGGGNSSTNEDLSGSQFKESNVYFTGQQSEGSAVWIAAPGRDMSSLPASSFYNLHPQGQHVTFTPTQAGHGTFANVYQPAQAVTAGAVHPLLQQSQAMAGALDMVGPAASVYQQPQHQQINWPGNY